MNDERWTGSGGSSWRQESDIPAVPRVPSIYRRQNSRQVQGSQGNSQIQPPVPNRPGPVRNTFPHPDPLRSQPTGIKSGLARSNLVPDFSKPARDVPGSCFPVHNRISPPVASYASMNRAPPDSTLVNAAPLHEVERFMVPVTHLPAQQGHYGFGASTSNLCTFSEGSERPVIKPQRSMFNLRRKPSATVSDLDQQNTLQNQVQPKPSHLALRKTTGRVMNLDQVAKGATPVTENNPDSTTPPKNLSSTPQSSQQTAKRQRSFFQLRKTPTQNSDTISSNRQPDQAEVDDHLWGEELILSKEPVSSSLFNKGHAQRVQSDSGEEALGTRSGETSREAFEPSPKHQRSIFNLRKASGNAAPPSTVPAIEQEQHEEQFSTSSRKFRSTMNFQPTNPSRIPSPVMETKARYSSAPAPFTQKKENIPPRTHRLMRPISPSQTQAPTEKNLPKARTLGMLSTFTSAFSRSNSNLVDATNASTISLPRTADPTTYVDNVSASAVQPTYTPHGSMVFEAREAIWWAGRFTSLSDRFHTETLNNAMMDPHLLRSLQDNNKCMSQGARDDDGIRCESSSKGQKQMADDEHNRTMRVFAHLTSICATEEARNSLFDFQQQYARMENNKNWLPVGGTMEDKPPGWVARMTNAISRRSEKSGTPSTTSMGRRTGMSASVFGKRGHANTQSKESDEDRINTY